MKKNSVLVIGIVGSAMILSACSYKPSTQSAAEMQVLEQGAQMDNVTSTDIESLEKELENMKLEEEMFQ